MADSSSKKFQAPKGTRDFYPADLAVRRHIENVWRQTSINHGFDEIDGPTFEHLDLYTHKSGPGIASELFQVFSGKDPEQAAALKKEGGLAPYALRPEFTPTLARMVAARAPELPRPIKWFAIPSHFRAESPQRGRLREFMQWNVDFIGDDSPRADAEVIATAVAALDRIGLKPTDVSVHFNNRAVAEAGFVERGVPAERIPELFELIDKVKNQTASELAAKAAGLGVSADVLENYLNRLHVGTFLELTTSDDSPDQLRELQREIQNQSIADWCVFDPGIVRGLAYYTGTVFEIIAEGERAIAGGGRYDKLIEGFGGPSLPACGFGMGDVVLANILKDKGLLKPAEEYLPRPDAFVIAANDDAAAHLPKIVADLRRQNLHVRQSYKTTRNVGKLLGDAGKCRAVAAIIIDQDLAKGMVKVKDLAAGTQKDDVAVADLAAYIDSLASSHRVAG